VVFVGCGMMLTDGLKYGATGIVACLGCVPVCMLARHLMKVLCGEGRSTAINAHTETGQTLKIRKVATIRSDTLTKRQSGAAAMRTRNGVQANPARRRKFRELNR
jgi:poly(3-hydroxybutyrate) depolymerase